MNLINTADCYAPSADEFGHNEKLVGKAVHEYSRGRESVFVVTKNGIQRKGNDWPRDNSPEYLLRAAEESNERLGFMPDAILIHRLNRAQSFAAAVEAMCEVRERGLAKYIGVSNVNRAELELAWEVSDGTIAIVENERSPRYREFGDVLDFCNEKGMAYLAWSPLGGGQDAAKLGELYPAFAEVGISHDATAQEIAIAWLLTQGTAMLPIPAFTRKETADSTARASEIKLNKAEIDLLTASHTGNGSLYPD
jgi:aryl-alcohol dehydrogenase-like predicted oxidoreductase